jgi:hypothetical protein
MALRFPLLFANFFFGYHQIMWKEGARRLELLAPLPYTPVPGLIPFQPGIEARIGRGEELLFCFILDTTQGRNIEPDPAVLLGPLAAAGSADPPGGAMELPRGRYLFAQERAFLDREDVILMAVELQKDGLWEGLGLENRLYLRYLHEEGSAVTQLFRPFKEPETPG